MGAGTWAGGNSGNRIVGAYGDSSGNGHAFLYNGTIWTTLDAPWAASGPTGKIVTEAFGIDGGNIVGAYTDSAYNAHGFLYDGTTWTALTYPGAIQTWALDINGDNLVGQVVDSSGLHGFLYNTNSGTWTALNYPGAVWTDAYGIEGNRIVGSYGDSSGVEHGYLYTDPSIVPLPGAALLGMIGLGYAGMRLRCTPEKRGKE